MKTNELYIKVLKKIRYGKLSEETLSLNDYDFESKEYKFIAQYNDVMNLLSDLITIMEEEAEE